MKDDQELVRALGFHVTRNTNEAAWATSSSHTVTFNNLIRQRGFLAADWASGASFTVPFGGGGQYTLQASAYWAAAVPSVFWGINVNGVAVGSNPTVTTDRCFVSALARLSQGDVISWNNNNLSGGNITVTAYAGDPQTMPLPTLQCWRYAV